MSTTESKALVERFFDAFNRSDFTAIEQEMLAPDYVNHNPPPMPGIAGDRTGMLAAMRYMRGAFPDARAEVIQLIAEGDRVVVHDIVRGTHGGDFMGIAPTGRSVAFEFVHVFRVADGRIAERWGLIDLMSLLVQLGVSPLPQPAHA